RPTAGFRARVLLPLHATFGVPPRPRRQLSPRLQLHPARLARALRRLRARSAGTRRSPDPAECAHATVFGHSPDRPTAADLRLVGLARRGGDSKFPSQRCLLSSPSDLLMSPATAWISARMAHSVGSVSIT